jgi:tetratricopeptide (TPR) repeat protein
VIEKIPLIALSALAAVVTFVVQGSRGAMAGLEAIPLGDRVSNALLAYVGYLGGALWPARLSVFYPHAGATASPAAVTGALALLVLLTGSALALLRRRPAIAVGWLWFLGMLVPVIGIVQVGEQAMADRYMYLPLIGLGIVAAYGPPESFFEAARRRGAAAALGLLVLLAFAWATHQHLPVWTDGVTLMRQALRSAGPNAFVHMGLGVALQRDEQHREAAQHFEQSLALDPRSAEAWVGLADALASLGDTGAARDAFARAGELPRSPRTQLQLHAGVGHALLTEGEHEEAARRFELALALEPERGRGRLHGLLAQSLFATGRTKEAHRHYRLALAIDPALTKARANFGFALMDAGELDEAL